MSDEHRLNVYLLSLLFLYFSLISGDFDAMEIFISDSKNLCFSFNLAKSALKTVNWKKTLYINLTRDSDKHCIVAVINQMNNDERAKFEKFIYCS